MSHFTKIATKLVDGDFIKDALVAMGYEPISTGSGVKGWQGQRTGADFKIAPAGSRHEIGFVRGPGGYEVVADWYSMSLRQGEFVSELTRQYALGATKATLARQGYQLAEESTSQDGVVRLVLTRQTGL